VAAFGEELVRAAFMLCGLAEDLMDAIPPEAYPGEEPGAVFIEMLMGTIATAVDDVALRDLERATDIIAAARDRVLEHLRLALELRRRMDHDAESGSGRAYG
jgi:hypothetical protein